MTDSAEIQFRDPTTHWMLCNTSISHTVRQCALIVLRQIYGCGFFCRLVSEVDSISLQKDAVLIVLQECEIPHLLSDLPYIEANKHGWWTKLLARLALPGMYTVMFVSVTSMLLSLKYLPICTQWGSGV